MRLLASDAAAPGSTCEGKYGELTLLGEIASCAPVDEGYEIWLEVEHSLDPRRAACVEVPETLGGQLFHLNQRLLECCRPAASAARKDCAGKRI